MGNVADIGDTTLTKDTSPCSPEAHVLVHKGNHVSAYKQLFPEEKLSIIVIIEL